MKVDSRKINWLRIEKGLSLTELCQISNVSKTTLTRLLKNKCDTRPDTVGKLAKALSVSAQELFITEEDTRKE